MEEFGHALRGCTPHSGELKPRAGGKRDRRLKGVAGNGQDSVPPCQATKFMEQSVVAETEPAPVWAGLTRQDTSPPKVSVEAHALTQLVHDVVAGDVRALAKFHDLFYGLVYKIAAMKAKLIKDLGVDNSLYSVDDLAQEAWLFLLHGVRVNSQLLYNQHSPPLPKWLSNPRVPLAQFIGSFVNHYLKDIKRNAIRGDAPSTLPLSEVGDIMADEGLAQAVRQCWCSLNEDYRRVLDLVYVQDLTQATAAIQLGISSSAVFRRLTAAKRALRKCLGGA